MIADWWLELRIWALYRLWLATSGKWSMPFLSRMCELIKQRSPRQIRRMEVRKGLA